MFIMSNALIKPTNISQGCVVFLTLTIIYFDYNLAVTKLKMHLGTITQTMP